MGTLIPPDTAGSSNSCKNSVSTSLLPYWHQLGHFHDLGMRFKGGRRPPFYARNYRSIHCGFHTTIKFLSVSSLNHKPSENSTATLYRNHKITSVNQWLIIVISPYHTKLLSQALTCLRGTWYQKHQEENFYGFNQRLFQFSKLTSPVTTIKASVITYNTSVQLVHYTLSMF